MRQQIMVVANVEHLLKKLHVSRSQGQKPVVNLQPLEVSCRIPRCQNVCSMRKHDLVLAIELYMSSRFRGRRQLKASPRFMAENRTHTRNDEARIATLALTDPVHGNVLFASVFETRRLAKSCSCDDTLVPSPFAHLATERAWPQCLKSRSTA